MEYALKQSATQDKLAGRILAVDDERSALLMLETLLKDFGCDVATARNGKEALELLKDHHDEIDIVVLDRMMPEMDGIALVEAMKQNPQMKFIPVVMQTGAGKPEEIRQGIDAGVMYYLTKPLDRNLLHSVIGTALNEAAERRMLYAQMHHQHASFVLMDTAKFQIRTLEEAESLACSLSSAFPEPEQIVAGLGHLLINAVEHGNLSIGYEDKARFIAEGRWREEVTRRCELPENRHKTVEVIFKRKQEGIFVQITDTGRGFDWWPYLEIDPARATQRHGRGIALASKLSFDKVIYKEPGNQVIAAIYHNTSKPVHLEW